MRPAALLDLCAQLVGRVLEGRAPADGVVSAFFREHRLLGPRERHTLAETAYAVLRRRLLWQHLAQSGQGALPRRLAILAWQGDASFLQAALTPPEQVWCQAMEKVDLASLPERLRHNLPAWVAEPLAASMGNERLLALAEALNEPAPLDLRVNTVKGDREAAQLALQALGVPCEPTPFSPWGLRVRGKPALHRLAPFEQGLVEVQDEGSQLLALLTGAGRGQMVVDFCAGAGGKTLALGAMMRNTGRLYAWDTSAHRLDALKPRLARSGLSNVHPAQLAHERDERIKRLAGKVDRVLVDAPCSGLGTLRRNPDLKWRQSPQSVAEMVQLQQAILASAARLLRPGGRLVYATCSLLEPENEAQARAFSQTHAQQFEPEDAAQVLASARLDPQVAASITQDGFLRLWPHLHHTDGFFAAVWRRR